MPVTTSFPAPEFDDEGYPVNAFDEVIPGLVQADTTYDPLQMVTLGFDVLVDLCGWDRGTGLEGLPYTFLRIDDVPWIDDKDAVHALGEQVAAHVREGKRVAVNCAAGLNRSGLIVGRALIELGYAPPTRSTRCAQPEECGPCRTSLSRSSCSSTAAGEGEFISSMRGSASRYGSTEVAFDASKGRRLASRQNGDVRSNTLADSCWNQCGVPWKCALARPVMKFRKPRASAVSVVRQLLPPLPRP
jgi:hypothetical protein